MRRVLAVLLASLAVTGVAAAQQERAPATTVDDPAGDGAGPLDARRVVLAQDARGRLRAEIAMRRAWRAGALRGGARGSGSICLRIWTRRDPDGRPADWLVCATPRRAGDRLAGRVLREVPDGLPRLVARARVGRPDRRTLRMRFARAAIGRPQGVLFSVEIVTRGEDCPRTLGCRDLAPDAPHTAALALTGD